MRQKYENSTYEIDGKYYFQRQCMEFNGSGNCYEPAKGTLGNPYEKEISRKEFIAYSIGQLFKYANEPINRNPVNPGDRFIKAVKEVEEYCNKNLWYDERNIFSKKLSQCLVESVTNDRFNDFEKFIEITADKIEEELTK